MFVSWDNLHSFEGALIDKHWDQIGEHRKQQLKAQIGYPNTYYRTAVQLLFIA
ncbi:TfoX/Sxy family DNA transformation protein [Desulfonatronovibrio magnus]|uniref:TfoX/Sxy family DNA transformation protein n=1 Tax=Desulfonatronovibrio magnus TaxID=698827 RepID=UPI000A057131